ncbi:MAG: sulfite exporter TauE/SafE family protein [Proteobacteria bacterium]|nr:MAG: sulfite exporter TauE/SafE family protein [Pseudomonadota bacterium]QKK10942.1 MAG: sulfite exporter TauE/SafE family protein [Pseudomonadota bacterium]
MSDPLFVWCLLLGASFLGGGLNAVAGGGSFFTFPALVYAGVPAVAANATGTLALLPGYIASTWGFREDLQARKSLSLRTLIVSSMSGGAIGAMLLLVTPDATFRAIVPWLLLVATLLFAIGPRLLRMMDREDEANAITQTLSLFAVSIYGGYFNGGLGIVLLAAFSLLGHQNLNAMNGLKNLASAVLTTIAVCLYAYGGAIVWLEATVMMISAIIGGYVAARIARRLPVVVVRTVVIATGTVMTVVFFVA